MRLQEANRPILVPAAVLVETINILGKRTGHETPVKAMDSRLNLDGPFVSGMLVEVQRYLTWLDFISQL